MVSPEIILEARNLSVIYGSPKREAVRMMEEGSDIPALADEMVEAVNEVLQG